MAPHPTTSDLERLTRLAPAVRSVALAVVRDGHVAEDVVQDALVVALEGGMKGVRDPRRWFAGVVRNLARRHVRSGVARERREAEVARSDGCASTAEVVARTETHRRVVAAVLALPEPYRETLLLRHFDDLQPREIAKRQGVPGGTVRSRLTRGVELLRERFDREADGDRRAWALALLPLLHPVGGTTALPTGAVRIAGRGRTRTREAAAKSTAGLGALLMAAKTHYVGATALALLVVALVAGVGYFVSNSRESAPSIHVVADAREVPVRAHVAAAEARADSPAGAQSVPEQDEPRAVLLFRGLVLRPDRSPAAGAHVRCINSSGSVIEGRATADGTFALSPRVMEGGGGLFTIQAWDDAGNAATERVPLMQGSTSADTPTLLLAPGHAVVVRVVDENGAPVRGARVVGREYDRLVLGIADSDDRGLARLDRLPDCDVVVRAYKEGAGRGMVMDVVAGRPAREVELRLTKRDVDVRVVDGDGTAVPGVRLFARHYRSGDRGTYGNFDPLVVTPPTDADGRTRVLDVATNDWFGLTPLAPTAPLPASGDAAALTGSGASVEPGVTEVEIVLAEATRLRWPIAAGSEGPSPGTRLRLVPSRTRAHVPMHHSAIARVEGAEVVADVDLPQVDAFHVIATAPDGSWCVLDAQAVGRPLTFHPPRAVKLRVLDAQGRPAAGLRAQAWADEFAQNILTDDAGECVLTGVPANAIDLRVWNGLSDGDLHRRESISGLVRIEPKDAEATLTLPPEYELVVHLLVDGKPRIPPTLREIHTGWGRGYGAIEDPSTGTVRVRVRREMKNALIVVARADGYLEARTMARLTESGEIAPVTLNLRTGAVLRGRVLADPGTLTVDVEKWDTTRERWQAWPVSRNVRGVSIRSRRPRGDGSLVVDGLPAGRYRLVAAGSSVASEPVDIEPGVLSPECILQVTESVTVTGRIELPEGVPFDQQLALLVECNGVRRGATPGRSSDGVVLTQDGHFTVTVPDGLETTLRVVHRAFAPHPELGDATVWGAARDVVLRLVEGGVTTLHLAPSVDASALPDAVPVFFFTGPELGEPVDMKFAMRHGHELRLAGHAAGTFTLWVDPKSSYAPVLLRDVALGEGAGGEIDLYLTTGASVEVTITDASARAQTRREGAILRATWASAGGYEHSRVREVRGGEPLVLTGLIPGTYDVQLRVLGATVLSAATRVTIVDVGQRFALDLAPR